MTNKQHLAHIISVVLPVAASAAIELLGPAGTLGHYHWSVAALAVVVYVVRAAYLSPPTPPTAKA